MKIIRLEEVDASSAANVYLQSWKKAYQDILPKEYLNNMTADVWEPSIRSAQYPGFVLMEHGQCIGVSRMSRAREKEMEGWGEIISVYLLPEYTGQGFGRLLLDHAIRFLCQKGYCRIYLMTAEQF